MRVDKDLALDLTAKSGIEGWFCEPLNWQDADVPNPAIRWMSKADDESEINYLQRVVAEKAAFGITRGEKQLGARTKRDTSVAHARTWTVQGAPDSWTQETLENILQKSSPCKMSLAFLAEKNVKVDAVGQSEPQPCLIKTISTFSLKTFT